MARCRAARLRLNRLGRELGQGFGVTVPEEIEDWEPVLEDFVEAVQSKRTVQDLIGLEGWSWATSAALAGSDLHSLGSGKSIRATLALTKNT